MDVFGLLFRAMGPSECFGIQGFNSRWILRVVGLPIFMGIFVLLIYVYERWRKSAADAAMNAKVRSLRQHQHRHNFPDPRRIANCRFESGQRLLCHFLLLPHHLHHCLCIVHLQADEPHRFGARIGRCRPVSAITLVPSLANRILS